MHPDCESGGCQNKAHGKSACNAECELARVEPAAELPPRPKNYYDEGSDIGWVETAEYDALLAAAEQLQRERDEARQYLEHATTLVTTLHRSYNELQSRLAQVEAERGWTFSEARRLRDFAEAHTKGDRDSAYNAIYWIVSDRAADLYNPWAEVEALAGQIIPLPQPPEGPDESK